MCKIKIDGYTNLTTYKSSCQYVKGDPYLLCEGYPRDKARRQRIAIYLIKQKQQSNHRIFNVLSHPPHFHFFMIMQPIFFIIHTQLKPHQNISLLSLFLNNSHTLSNTIKSYIIHIYLHTCFSLCRIHLHITFILYF